MKHTNNQRGAVSLFVVIFTTLLVTIVTVSFVRIMLQNQQNASVVDISQSAYDSALAGVEDAKRALVLGNGTIANGDQCNSVKRALDGSVDASDMSETKIQQSLGGDNGFEQAYTCVKVDGGPRQLTADLSYQNTENASVMLELDTGDQRFKTIEIEWSLPKNNEDDTQQTITPYLESGLPRGGEQWGEATPAMLRAQLIQYDGSFSAGDFDSSAKGVASKNARTKFLYPASTLLDTQSSFRFTNDQLPSGVSCSEASGKCSARLTFDSNGNYKENVFLRLTSLYNDANVTIRAFANNETDPSDALRFFNVQAVVDSTGRAGDAFRRVSAVVDLRSSGSFPYPEAALDLEGSLCKTFGVTDNPDDYSRFNAAQQCDPASDGNADANVDPTP